MKPPIFIVGEGRSGTTALRKMLGEHPAIWAVPKESYVFAKKWPQANPCYKFTKLDDLVLALAIGMNRVGQSLNKRGAAKYTRDVLAGGELESHIQGFMDSFKASEELSVIARNEAIQAIDVFDAICKFMLKQKSATRFVEKTPYHLYCLDEIRASYPEAKIIAIYRDPRAVVLSWLRRKASLKSLLGAAQSWSRATTEMLKHKADPNYKIIRYEDLISEPETSLKDLMNFIGEDFVPELLKEQKVNSSFEEQRGQTGMQLSSLNRWQEELSPLQIALIDKVCGQHDQELGLEMASSSNLFLGIYYLYQWFNSVVIKSLKFLSS